MADISDITLRIRVDIVNSAAILALVNSMTKVEKQAQKVENANKKMGSSVTLASRAFDKMVGHLSAVERKLDAVFRAGVHMQSMGRDLLGWAKKMTGVLKNLTDEWGDYEFTLLRAAAASNIFDTQSAIYDQLKQAIYGVAHELRVFPAEEVARGLYFWQSTTGDTIETTEQLRSTMKNVTAVMKLAAMTNTGYETTIKGVYAVLKQFHKGTKDTADVSALLFYATQKTALELPDLIHAFKMTGSVMGQAKEPLETMVAVLGTIGNAGFRGSQAGRALRQTYIKLVKPTKAAKKELDELFKSQGGYNKVAFDSKGNFVGIEKYMMRMAKATKGMTYQQRAHLLATVTTANELPVMTQMLAAAERAVKSGSKSWVENLASQEKANANFKKSWDNMAVSWKGVVGGLKQSVQPVFLETGRMIAKLLTPALNELNVVIWDNVPAMTAMAKEVVESFKPMVTWISETVRAIIKWSVANPKIVKQIAKFAIIGTIIAGIAGAALLAAGTFVFLLNTAILILVGMLPLIAVFAALIAIVTLFSVRVYQNFAGIQQAFRFFVESFKMFLKTMGFDVAGTGDIIKTVLDIVNRVADTLVAKLADALIWLGRALQSVTPEQAETIKKVVAALLLFIGLNKGLNIVNDAVKATAESMRGFTAAAKGAAAVGSASLKAGATAAEGTTNIISGAIVGLMAVARVVGPAIMGLLSPVVLTVAAIAAVIAGLVLAYETNFLGFRDFVNGVVSWFISDVLPVIQSVIGAVVEFITTVLLPALQEFGAWLSATLGPLFAQVGDAVTAFGEFVAAMWAVVEPILKAIGDAMGALWQWISEVLLGIGIDVSGFSLTIEGLFAALSLVVNNIVMPWLNGMVTFFRGIFEGIVKFVTGVFRIIEGIFQVFTAILTGDWKKAFEGIGNIVGGFVDTVLAFLGTLFGMAETAVRTGIGIIDGIFKTIFGEGPDSIYGHIKGFITTIVNFAGDVIGGFVKGIGDAIGPAIKSVTGFIGDIVDGIKDFLGIKSPATMMLSIGKNIVLGIWKGINDAKDWIIDKVLGFIKDIIPGPIKDALGIHSPSRVMAAIGVNIVEGLAAGIVKTEDAVVAMSNLSNELITTAQETQANIGFAASGNMNVSKVTDNLRTIRLEVDVTSGDGSVNSLETDTLAALITGSDMVRALERMASVD